MTPHRLVLALLLCTPALCLSAQTLSAQTLSAQTWTAKKIIFKNPGAYSQAQLEAASGMHAGSSASAATMQVAAQKLADSGFFDDVRVVLDGTAANTSVIFTLAPTPTKDMLPLGFENFLWLTPEEMKSAILQRIPLYTGVLPEGSPNADLIDEALTQALSAKSIPAKVHHETVEPTLEHPLRTIEYRLITPSIRVANVKLQGVDTALVPLVQKSVNATARTPFNDGLNGKLTREIILAPLLDAGYIQARLDTFSPDIQPIAQDLEPVIVSAHLTAGEIFHLSTITFAGAPLLSADSFAATAKLHPGDIASRKLLLETLTPLDSAYRRQGYMDVIVNATPTADEANHRVAYTVTVTPGTPYHLHEISPMNLTATQQAAFNRAFMPHPGDVYNPEYVTSFLKNNTSVRELDGCSMAYKATAYPATHTVDLVLSFACPVQVKG